MFNWKWQKCWYYILYCSVYICLPTKHAPMTQDIDPSRRPGAGPDGYTSLKTHPFFRGVDWKNLRAQGPPKMASEQKVCFYAFYFPIWYQYVLQRIPTFDLIFAVSCGIESTSCLTCCFKKKIRFTQVTVTMFMILLGTLRTLGMVQLDKMMETVALHHLLKLAM